MEVSKQDLDTIETGLKLFDTDIPTVLGDEIKAVGVDELGRLVIVATLPRKAAQFVAKEVLRIFYLWNFACDFKDDFFAEAEEQTGTRPAPTPPRIVLAVDQPPVAAGWSYLRNLRDSFIDIDIYQLSELATNGGKERAWLKVDWPEKIKPVSRTALHRFNKANVDITKRHTAVWEQVACSNPYIKGYDRGRELKRTLKADAVGTERAADELGTQAARREERKRKW